MIDTRPFGTQHDLYDGEAELARALDRRDGSRPRRSRGSWSGTERCAQPYAASLLNISAMSFGSLSQARRPRAQRRGASSAASAHNTGEGGLSPYHLERGGDLVWQIGTGYFGCRTRDGSFDAGLLRERARSRRASR